MKLVEAARRSVLVAGAVMALLPLAEAGHAAGPEKGGVLVVGTTEVPRHLNPAVQSGVATATPGAQLFASPLRFDADWNPQPYLAKSWAWSDDGLALTLHLVENATFHDGTPITSEDVAFSILANREHHPFKAKFGTVEAIDTPDPHTAIIRLSRPHPALLLSLSPALAPIMPKHIYGDGQDLKSHPRNSADVVGSGPFRLVEFVPDKHVVLERNPDFFIEGRPYLDRIVNRIFKDESSLVIAMQGGEIDLRPYLTTVRDIERLREDPAIEVTDRGYGGIGPLVWLAFNTQHPVLQDRRVRQAIAYAIDRDFIVRALHRGVSRPATGPIVPGSPFYSDALEPYAVDLDKARALLAEAGYGDGLELTIDYAPGAAEQRKNVAEYLKAQLRKVGIDLNVRASPDFPTWARRVSSHEFDVSMDLVFNWGDPVIGVHRTYLCDNITKGVIWSNTQSYCNPKVDELLDAAGQETDPARRKELYAEFQKIVVEDAPITFINVVPYHTAYRADVKNPPTTIWGAMSPMDEVYLDR
ncbi:ABC transporter substrate-binding protein [Geminicoccaceae bacterium 1502E]|nr:ABC transporter substrate-binding protein [Geminicoccaceae bacterium 1502E]